MVNLIMCASIVESEIAGKTVSCSLQSIGSRI